MKRKTLLSIALCSFAVSAADGRVLIVPDGPFQTRDSRELSLYLSPENGRAIALASVEASSPFIVDYEHQTLLSETNGQPAPLSGQGDHLEYVEGEGLYAVEFKWTKRALKYLEDEEYGFISPVVLHDKDTGEIKGVPHAALTNFQAIDEMPHLSRLAAKYQTNQPSGENEMNEAQMKLLGLEKDADDATVLAALTALVKKASDSEDEVTALKAVAKTGEAKPDLSKYVPISVVEELKTEMAALSGKIKGDEASALITSALSDGRLLSAQKDWANDLGESDLDALKGYLDSAQPIAALKGTQTGGKGPEVDAEGQLSGTAADVANAFGNSVDDLKKYG